MKLMSARHSWVTGYQTYYIVLWKQTKNCQLVITNYSLSQNGSPFPHQPSMPQLTGCEFQTNVLNTLTLVLPNQQFIINELKEIKQNIAVLQAVCQEGGNISTLENVVGAQVETAPSVPLLTLDQLTELKEKQANNSKTAKVYLAVLIMNAFTTKEQRIARSVFGSKTKPSLDSNIVQ